MQFNSYIFIFFFLPLTLVGFYQIAARRDRQAAMMWLVIMSLIFYSWWNVNYLGLFCFSMFLNFTLGSALTGDLDLPLSRPWLLRLGIFFNLGLLAYFKYAGLTVASINGLLGTEFNEPSVLLPLAISFFTFQQIAYLVDTFRGKVKELSFVNYCLFISFFPQLIAGPIVYYRELIPQFLRREGAATNTSGKPTFRCNPEDIIVGLTLFSMGLFKKAVFADSLSPITRNVFQTAAVGGVTLTHFEAWVGAISFALQVYFDFSGYTDMAIGAARMFGVKLPINFNSPFKSITISQFWRTWHMTLTRFMREYVYFPLSGWLQNLTLEEETGPHTPGDINLVTTTTTVIVMLLIGIWHGAGWSFLIWGAINGIYLIGYQQWREFRRRLGHDLRKTTWWSQLLGWFLTFVMWCSALVWARSDSVFTALKMWQGMYFGGWTWPDLAAEQLWSDVLLPHVGLKLSGVLFWIPVLLAIAVLTPNSQQWLEKYQPALDHYVLKTPKNLYQKFWLRWRWQINPYWAVIVAVVSTMAIIAVGNEKEFIYFQF